MNRSRPRIRLWRRILLGCVVGAAVTLAVYAIQWGLQSVGSGYGIDKSADRSHELAGVRDAAAILSQVTGGLVVVDTSPASLVFDEEHTTATTSVAVGHCRVQGVFRHVPYNTNDPLSASNLGPLYLTGSHNATVTIEPTGTGQLAAIRASSLAGCLKGASLAPTPSG